MRERSIRFAMAEYALEELANAGSPIHRDVLIAGIDLALTKAGRHRRLAGDYQEFSRIMRLAKVLGLAEGSNPFPLYEVSGYWALGTTGATLSVRVLAAMRAVKVSQSRLRLLSEQFNSEFVHNSADHDDLRTEVWLAAEADDLAAVYARLESLHASAVAGGQVTDPRIINSLIQIADAQRACAEYLRELVDVMERVRGELGGIAERINDLDQNH